MNKESWEIKKLGKLCEILDSRRKPITKKDRKSGIYPYYGATGIQDYIDDYIFDGKYVLVGEDGAKWNAKDNTAFIVEGKCWVNNHAHVLLINEDVVDQWIVYYLNHRDLNEYITGAVVPKLNQAALRSIPIPVPSLSIQNQIVAELDELNNILDKKRKQLEELDTLAQTTFYDMFGDPVENEKGWQMMLLSDIGSIGRGVSKHRPRNAPELLGGEYPLIQTGEVARSGLYITEYTQTYSDIGLKQSKLWNKGTLCITIAANIAQTSIMNFDACFPDSIVGFKNNTYSNVVFVHYWFTFFQKILEEQAPQVAQKNINLKILNELKVIVPPLTLQNQFAERIEAIEKQKELINKSIVDVQLLYDYTMDRYFN